MWTVRAAPEGRYHPADQPSTTTAGPRSLPSTLARQRESYDCPRTRYEPLVDAATLTVADVALALEVALGTGAAEPVRSAESRRTRVSTVQPVTGRRLWLPADSPVL